MSIYFKNTNEPKKGFNNYVWSWLNSNLANFGKELSSYITGTTTNIKDEGSPIVSTHDINFVGAGVTVTENPLGVAEINIPGGGGIGGTNYIYVMADGTDVENAADRYLILDFQRVQSIDMTAAHMLDRVRAQLAERGATLLLSRLPFTLPTGRNLRGYLKELGVTHSGEEIRIFDDFTDALEWVEEETLRTLGVHVDEGHPLKLEEFEIFSDMQPSTLAALQRCVQKRFYAAGETIFIAGTPGDSLMLIAHGSVRIDLLLEDARRMHMATFGRGQFFGEMSFLDHHPHSADVSAVTDTELVILPRPDFDRYATEDPVMASHVFASLSIALADRLRHTNEELRALESG